MRLTDKITVSNEDCMDLLKRLPDKSYEVGILDPPYGIGAAKTMGLRKKWHGSYTNKKHVVKDWDNQTPPKEFWDEVFRVTRNQIVFGANHFELPPSKGIAAWDKQCDGTTFSHFELIWTSFEKPAQIFRYPIQGESQNRFHPTQKSVAIYKWLLQTYCKAGDKILDCFLGSGSIALACHDYDFELLGCELDKDYYDAAVKRIRNHVSQTKLF